MLVSCLVLHTVLKMIIVLTKNGCEGTLFYCCELHLELASTVSREGKLQRLDIKILLCVGVTTHAVSIMVQNLW